MNIIKFIYMYWDVIFAVVAGLGAAASIFVKGELSSSNEKLFELITNAEKTYGAGTGILKKASVVADFSQSLSFLLRAIIGENRISVMVEKALEKSKDIWNETQGIREYINTKNK